MSEWLWVQGIIFTDCDTEDLKFSGLFKTAVDNNDFEYDSEDYKKAVEEFRKAYDNCNVPKGSEGSIHVNYDSSRVLFFGNLRDRNIEYYKDIKDWFLNVCNSLYMCDEFNNGTLQVNGPYAEEKILTARATNNSLLVKEYGE